MGKRSQARARWVTRVRMVHEKPAVGPVWMSPAVYVVMCMDCDAHLTCDVLHEAHVWAKDHLLKHPKHETFLEMQREDDFGGVEVEEVELWENVSEWGPSVGLEIITKEKYEEMREKS